MNRATTPAQDPAKSRSASRPSRELDDLVAELTDRLGGDEEVDIEGFLAAHPEHAERLRQILPALEMMAALSRPGEVSATQPRPAGRLDVPGPEVGDLGDYRILRELGRGGMGVVYEAIQVSLDRRVALKVLPFAAALDAHQLQRFKTEAQAAAQLHHTNIVPVFSIGCERGVHYYAMQYIEGRTLAALIQEQRRLEGRGPAEAATIPAVSGAAPSATPSSRDRGYIKSVAELGIQAAEALDYAHKLGIIHRDIKPANLLLDVRGNLWITDFGLARFQEDTGVTMTGDLLGTLRYMSPEQALAQRAVVDHRTDIYSLGVTLYEVATLHAAIEGTDRRELLRKIAEHEPPSARSLNPAVPRELETILLKAINKEAVSRYATAKELAEDLRRFLEDKPIRAKRPTVAERVAKWSRRHAALIGAAVTGLTLAVAGLLVAMVLATSAYHREAQQRALADAQRRRAETHLRQARDAVDQMLTQVGESLGGVPRMESVRRTLLEKALAFYEKFLVEEGDDPAIRQEAGRALRRVGGIRRLLGQNDRALEAYRGSVELLGALVATRPSDLDCRRELAQCHADLGGLLDKTGHTQEAEREFRQAIELRRDILERHSGNPGDRLGWAIVQARLGWFFSSAGRLAEAREVVRPVRDVLERLVADFPGEAAYHSAFGAFLNDLGAVALAQNDQVEARSLFELAVTHQQAALKIDPRNVQHRVYARNHEENLALVLNNLGRRREAERSLGQCIAIGEALRSDFPLVPAYRFDLAGSYANLALLVARPGHHEEAVQASCQALKLFQELVVEQPGVPEYRRGLAAIHNNLGGLFTALHRWKDAEQSFRDGMLLFEALVSAQPANAVYRHELASTKVGLAALLAVRADVPVHDPAQASRLAQEASKLEPGNASHWITLSLAEYRVGNWKRSMAAIQEAMRRSNDARLDPSDGFVVAMVRWRLGEKDAARKSFDRAATEMAKNNSQDETTLWLRDEAAALLGADRATTLEDKETSHPR